MDNVAVVKVESVPVVEVIEVHLAPDYEENSSEISRGHGNWEHRKQYHRYNEIIEQISFGAQFVQVALLIKKFSMSVISQL